VGASVGFGFVFAVLVFGVAPHSTTAGAPAWYGRLMAAVVAVAVPPLSQVFDGVGVGRLVSDGWGVGVAVAVPLTVGVGVVVAFPAGAVFAAAGFGVAVQATAGIVLPTFPC